MEIFEDRVNNIDVLKLKGRLEASASKTIKDRISTLAKQNRVNLVIDMSDVDFIDSSGLGSLVSCLRSVNKSGGDIKITSLQDHVRAIFELTRLHRIFQIFDDNIAASNSF
jgi:anti-sigma B factor antagonist